MRKKPILEAAVETLNVPAEVALGTVKLTLLGSSELRVLNHKGVLVYESRRIVFATNKEPVQVTGEALTLSELKEDFLTVRGRIRSIRIGEEEQKHHE